MAAQQQSSTSTASPAETGPSAPASNGIDTVLSDYVHEDVLALEMHLSPRTLRRWRKLRKGPPYLVISRQPYYRRDAVKAWLRSQEQSFEVQGARTRHSAGR
jgi:hypothetical protein